MSVADASVFSIKSRHKLDYIRSPSVLIRIACRKFKRKSDFVCFSATKSSQSKKKEKESSQVFPLTQCGPSIKAFNILAFRSKSRMRRHHEGPVFLFIFQLFSCVCWRAKAGWRSTNSKPQCSHVISTCIIPPNAIRNVNQLSSWPIERTFFLFVFYLLLQLAQLLFGGCVRAV